MIQTISWLHKVCLEIKTSTIIWKYLPTSSIEFLEHAFFGDFKVILFWDKKWLWKKFEKYHIFLTGKFRSLYHIPKSGKYHDKCFIIWFKIFIDLKSNTSPSLIFTRKLQCTLDDFYFVGARSIFPFQLHNLGMHLYFKIIFKTLVSISILWVWVISLTSHQPS